MEDKPNPNANINHLNITEDLISKAANHIEAIVSRTAAQQARKVSALKGVKNLQETELFELRQGIENG